jgi:hypothetical protein
MRTTVKSEIVGTTVHLHVPLELGDLQALESDGDPNGAFEVHSDEPRVFQNAVNENVNLDGLAPAVRLAKRNCIN